MVSETMERESKGDILDVIEMNSILTHVAVLVVELPIMNIITPEGGHFYIIL